MDDHKEEAGPTYRKRLMWPGHAGWADFLEKLEGPDGCDFKKDENGKITWRCKGGKDKSLAVAIMQSMGDGEFALRAHCGRDLRAPAPGRYRSRY